MAQPAYPEINGHGPGSPILLSGDPGAVPETMLVPPMFRAKLLEMTQSHEKARHDLALYVDVMLMALKLPPDTLWRVNTDTMAIEPVAPDAPPNG